MSESEFRKKLYNLFDNNYIYNNPLIDELDEIINTLIVKKYNINNLIYRELIRCFAIKIATIKTGIMPTIRFKNQSQSYANFYKDEDEYVIEIDAKRLNQKAITIDLEHILHEVEHMYQSLDNVFDPFFHNMVKDEILMYYFYGKYYEKNYSGISFEMDAFITAREEIWEYLNKNIPNTKLNFETKEDAMNALCDRIFPIELAHYRIINRTFKNYKKFINYNDIDQIFDKFMLEITSSNETICMNNNFININEAARSIDMQYNLDGSVKSSINHFKTIDKYQKQINMSNDNDKNEMLNDLINVHNYFVFNRSYNPSHIIRELLSFSKYTGKDKNILENISLVIEMFTDMVLYSYVEYERNKNKYYIKDEEIDYIDYAVDQINKNNTYIPIEDEYLFKLKNDIYKNSIEILNLMKEDMINKKQTNLKCLKKTS